MYIILIGMMGSGKSRVGKELAARLQLPVIELDALLAQSFAKPIAQVFAIEGEAAFRKRESELMLELAQRRRSAVLSLGGGSVLSAAGMEALKEVGVVVFLRAGVASLAARLRQSPNPRPLLATAKDLEGRLSEILANREALYISYADLIVDTDGKSPRELAAIIAAWWKEGQNSEL